MATPTNYTSSMHSTAAQVNYDEAAATYATECWPTIDSYYNLIDLVRVDANASVLDAGCSVGHMGVLASLKQNSPSNVYFVDQSREMIHEARKNMNKIWGEDTMNRFGDHFIIGSFTTGAKRRQILESANKEHGFDIVFAKNFVSQFLENARIPVIHGLISVVKDNGMLVCNIPQLAVSRNIIYPDAGARTALGTRTMVLTAASALPTDLLPLRDRATFGVTRFDVLVRNNDIVRAKDEIRNLMMMVNKGVVYRMEDSFQVSGAAYHNETIWQRAIHRLTLQDQPVQTRVDVQRREWVRSTISQAPEWGHRTIEVPLSVDVAL